MNKEVSKLTNSQLVMATDVQALIEKLKAEGKEYSNIKKACLQEFRLSHWLVTDKTLREEAIAVALFAYAMSDKQREAVRKIKELTGQTIL